MLFGFDPVVQVIHEEDVVNALAHATIYDVPGTYNVAAPGAMPLFKLTGLAGKFPVPVLHPIAYLGESFLGPQFTPIDFDYLRYACVGDLQRMREDLEFEPAYTAEDAVREFAARAQAKSGCADHDTAGSRRRTPARRHRTPQEHPPADGRGGPARHQPRGHTEADVVAESADSSLYEEKSQ